MKKRFTKKKFKKMAKDGTFGVHLCMASGHNQSEVSDQEIRDILLKNAHRIADPKKYEVDLKEIFGCDESERASADIATLAKIGLEQVKKEVQGQ